jgi:CHAT domain/Ternary complex associated domain 7
MSTVAPKTRLAWSNDFIIVDGETPAAVALAQIKATNARWIVLRRHGGIHLYALRRYEILGSSALAVARGRNADLMTMSLDAALDLHEHHESTMTPSREAPPSIDLTWRPDLRYASVRRYVERTAAGAILAVGAWTTAGGALRGPMGMEDSAKATEPVGSAPSTPDEDEGRAPMRYPSIDSDGAPAAGQTIMLTIDLRREATEHTHGIIDLGVQDATWTTLSLEVKLDSREIDFQADGKGRIEVRRNADSVPTIIKGRVCADLNPGAQVFVSAQFWDRTRICGMAVRVFAMSGGTTLPVNTAVTPTVGTVVVERNAVAPDLTVDIAKLDKDRPGTLRWSVVTPRFDGLPPQLSADMNLGQDTAAEAVALFKEFAKLEPGKHRNRIEAFGTRLWRLAPCMFHDVYWALWDHYKRPLTIQFISDEPHLPWELMCPERDKGNEFHPPLALMHPTARWIKRYDGYMRNHLPGGKLVTIAPKYQSISVVLPRAEAEAQALVDQFGATKVAGTHANVTDLFEHSPPADGVAVVHFAGHGKFSADMADSSFIKLEGTDVLAASEIDRPKVQLGRACRTLVFFNACEVGASGSVFGEIGGWANAFLARQFGGFIAPLWSVEDKDAGEVSADLIKRIYKNHETIGEALRAIREANGDRSPTYFSYLYYGDVTAWMGTRAGV